MQLHLAREQCAREELHSLVIQVVAECGSSLLGSSVGSRHHILWSLSECLLNNEQNKHSTNNRRPKRAGEGLQCEVINVEGAIFGSS